MPDPKNIHARLLMSDFSPVGTAPLTFAKMEGQGVGRLSRTGFDIPLFFL